MRTECDSILFLGSYDKDCTIDGSACVLQNKLQHYGRLYRYGTCIIETMQYVQAYCEDFSSHAEVSGCL